MSYVPHPNSTIAEMRQNLSQTSPAGCDFLPGQRVYYRNPRTGCIFGPYEVLGYNRSGRVYINSSSRHYPNEATDLIGDVPADYPHTINVC